MVLSAFAGCAKKEEAAPATDGGETAPVEEMVAQELYWNLGADPKTLDPGLNETVDGGHVANNMFEGLMREVDGQLVNGMASAYEVSEDLLTYTFTIREGVLWSDGQALTAKDFEYAWNRVLDPATASPYAWIYDEANVESVEAPDESTFVVHLKAPAEYFLGLTGFATFFPVRQDAVEAGADGTWAKNPEFAISNGPFKLADYTIGDSLVLVKNENYWNADSVKLEKIVAKFIVEESTAHTAFEAGEIQVNINKTPAAEVPTLLAESDEFYIFARPGTYYFNLNMENPAFQDERVRKALSYAIDRTAVTEMLNSGNIPANNLIPPGIIDSEGNDFNEKAGGFGIPLDSSKVEEAKALMAEAGYPNGEGFPEIEYLTNAGEGHLQVAQAVQEMWKKHLGVNLKISSQEWAVFSETRKAHNFEVARGGWIGDYVDPLTFIGYFITGNPLNDPQFSDENFDKLIADSAFKTAQERMELLYQADEILLSQGAAIPIYHYVDKIQLATEVKDMKRTFLGKVYFGMSYIEE